MFRLSFRLVFALVCCEMVLGEVLRIVLKPEAVRSKPKKYPFRINYPQPIKLPASHHFETVKLQSAPSTKFQIATAWQPVSSPHLFNANIFSSSTTKKKKFTKPTERPHLVDQIAFTTILPEKVPFIADHFKEKTKSQKYVKLDQSYDHLKPREKVYKGYEVYEDVQDVLPSTAVPFYSLPSSLHTAFLRYFHPQDNNSIVKEFEYRSPGLFNL